MPAVQRPNLRFFRRRPLWRGVAHLMLLALMSLLAACGATTSSGLQPGGPTSTPTTSPGGTPVASQPPTPAVALSSDGTSYSPSSTITVTLTNHRSTSIYTFDHQTGCTILTLQRQTAKGWEATGGCAMGRLTQQIEIKAGETRKIPLAPGTGQIRATPWPTGTYQVVFTYALQREGLTTGATTTVVTPTFTIS